MSKSNAKLAALTAELEAMTGPQLVKFYNERAAKLDDNLVKRFSTRAVAIARCVKIESQMPQTEAAPKKPAPAVELPLEEYGDCPHCGIHLSNGVVTDGDEGVNGDAPIKTKEFKYVCMACDKEFGPRVRKPRATSGNLSEAIAKSWTDPEVKAKRATRHAVRVVSKKAHEQEFRSVRQAFIALQLPLNEHIKFRMELKAAGTLSRYDHCWTVIEA